MNWHRLVTKSIYESSDFASNSQKSVKQNNVVLLDHPAEFSFIHPGAWANLALTWPLILFLRTVVRKVLGRHGCSVMFAFSIYILCVFSFPHMERLVFLLDISKRGVIILIRTAFSIFFKCFFPEVLLILETFQLQ